MRDPVLLIERFDISIHLRTVTRHDSGKDAGFLRHRNKQFLKSFCDLLPCIKKPLPDRIIGSIGNDRHISLLQLKLPGDPQRMIISLLIEIAEIAGGPESAMHAHSLNPVSNAQSQGRKHLLRNNEDHPSIGFALPARMRKIQIPAALLRFDLIQFSGKKNGRRRIRHIP